MLWVLILASRTIETTEFFCFDVDEKQLFAAANSYNFCGGISWTGYTWVFDFVEVFNAQEAFLILAIIHCIGREHFTVQLGVVFVIKIVKSFLADTFPRLGFRCLCVCRTGLAGLIFPTLILLKGRPELAQRTLAHKLIIGTLQFAGWTLLTAFLIV